MVNCIEKSGIAELQESYDKHRKTMDEHDASIRAVADYHKTLFDDLNDIRAKAGLRPAAYVPYDVSGINAKYEGLKANATKLEIAKPVKEASLPEKAKDTSVKEPKIDGYVNGRPVAKLGTAPGKIKVQYLDGEKESGFVPRKQFAKEDALSDVKTDQALKSVTREDPLASIVTDKGVNYEQLKNVARGIERGELEIKRLDPAGEQGRVKGGSRAIEATLILAANERAGEAAGSRTQPVKRQERVLEEYAKREGIWLDAKAFAREQQGFISKGVEAYVHRADDTSVSKLIDYKMIDRHATPLDFLDNRISLFNNLFPGAPYELVGFTRDSSGDFRFVVKQPFIRDAAYSTPTERQAYMQGKGLTMTDKYGEAFANKIYHVSDVHEKNALRTPDGTIVVIDAVPKAKHVQPFSVVEPESPLKSVTPQIQTDTPEFKKWFGDSKVVDRRGNPLEVYRGESESRDIFPDGGFFTDSPKDASAYAELAALTQAVDRSDDLSEIVNDTLAEEGGDALTDLGPQRIRDIADANGIDLPDVGGHITPAYLKIENPLDLTDFGSDVGDVAELWDKLHDKGLLDEAWSDIDEDAQYEIEQDYDGMALYRFLEAEGIQAKAFENGFDGVIFTDVSPDGGKTHTTWLVKDPTQIKSAIGNSGAFDPNEPSILKKRRTAESLELQKKAAAAKTSELMKNLSPDDTYLLPNGDLWTNEWGAESLDRLIHDYQLANRGQAGETASYSGLAFPASLAKKVADYWRQIRPEWTALGYTDEHLEGTDALMSMFEYAGEEAAKMTVAGGDDWGLMLVHEDARPHELTHVEERRLGGSTPEFISHAQTSPLYQALADNAKFQKDYPNIKPSDAVSELAAMLAPDDLEQPKYYGLDAVPNFEAQRKMFLNDWANDLIEKNKNEIEKIGPDEFLKRFETVANWAPTGDENYAENYQGVEKAGREAQSGESPTAVSETGNAEAGPRNEVRPERAGQQDAGSEAVRGGEDERKLKERQTVNTMHEKGLINRANTPAATRLYEVKSSIAGERAAQDHVEKVGLTNALAEAVLPPIGVDKIAHEDRQMAVIQALSQQAEAARNSGNTDAFDYYEGQIQAVLRGLAPEATEAGQFIQRLSRWKITNPSTVLARVKLTRIQNGLAPEIEAKLQSQIVDAAERLQQAQATIDAQAAKVRELESGKKPYKVKNEHTKPLTRTEKKVRDYTQALADKAMERLLGSPVLKMVAWHGSPHTFDKFRLDDSTIGTGEGAQAYGHGLYFAGSEAVAQHYKDSLGDIDVQLHSKEKQLLRDNTAVADLVGELERYIKSSQDFPMFEDAAAWYEKRLKENLPIYEKAVRDGAGDGYKEQVRRIKTQLLQLDELRALKPVLRFERQGAKYKVDLKPPEDSYLLWDKPLSEQSAFVKKALASSKVSKFETHTAPYLTGRDAYMTIGQDFRRDRGRSNDKAASDHLKSLGIRGIKYLDGSSRGKGEGNYNYVIFDDKDVEIQEILKSVTPDSPLAQDVLDDLTEVGALMLLDGWHGEPITPEQFVTNFEKIFSKQYSEYYPQIHAESVKKMTDRIREQKQADAIASIRGEKGNEDKSNAEIQQIIADRKADQKANNAIRNEHRKLAKDYLDAPVKAAKVQAKTQGEIEDFLDTAAKLDPFADSGVLTVAIDRAGGVRSAPEAAKRLRQMFPERFAPSATDKVDARKEKLRDLNHTIAAGEKLYKEVSREQARRKADIKAKLAGQSPEDVAAYDAAKRERTAALTDLTSMVKQAEAPPSGFWHKVAQVSRASKVALFQTAFTNLLSTKIEQTIANKPIDTIDIILQKIFKGLKDEGLDRNASLATAWWTPNAHKPVDEVGFREWAKGMSKHEIFLKAIDEHPEYFAKVFGDFSPDLHTGTAKVLDRLMIPMRIQEFFMRDSAAVKALAQRAAMKGIDFAKALHANDMSWVTKDDMDYALNEALSLTYALRPTRGGGITDAAFSTVASAIRSSGLLDVVGSESAPFLNFMWNTINKYKTKLPGVAQLRLVGKTVSEAKRLKAEGEEPNYVREAIRNKWTSRQLANQMWGIAALGAVYGIVKALGDRDDWNKIRIPGTEGMGRDGGSLYLDIRSQPLLAPMFFVANKMNRMMNGKDAFTYDNALGEMTEAFLGTSYRGAIEQNTMFNAFYYGAKKLISEIKGDPDQERNGERFALFAQKWLGNQLGTMTNFLQFKTFKDIAAQVDEHERHQLNLDEHPILQGIDTRLPESRRVIQDILKMQIEARKNYATDKENVRTPVPGLKIFGFNLADEADLRPEPTQAEILAAKLKYGSDSYTPPQLADEKKKAAIKRDFRKAGEKMTPGTPEANALTEKLQSYDTDLTPGQIGYAKRSLFTTDLQDNFKGLNADQATRVWQAATPDERQKLEADYIHKLESTIDDRKKSPAQRKSAQDAMTALAQSGDEKAQGRLGSRVPPPANIKAELDKHSIDISRFGDEMVVERHGPKEKMSDEQFNKYRKGTLERLYQTLNGLIADPSYQNAKPGDQAVMLNRMIRRVRAREQKNQRHAMMADADQ